MKHDKKSFLRKLSLIRRRKKYKKADSFKFNLIFKLIKKKFKKKRIVIAGYYPTDFEVNVLKFLESAYNKNFKIVLPVVKSSKKMVFKKWNYLDPLLLNKFGIPEPESKKREITPDLIMVPLVAFDKNLNRIGYGKGFYDRYLEKVSKKKKNLIILGIAYSFQKYLSIPTNKHDFKLDYIFTERGIISSK